MRTLSHLRMPFVWLAVILVGALAAPSLAQTKITIATHWSANQKEYLDVYIEEYNRLNPDVEVEHITFITSVDINEYLNQALVAHAGGSAPDILHIYSLWGFQLADSGVIVPAPPDVAAQVHEEYVGAASLGASIHGELYGIPTEIQNYMVLYNKDQLEQHGYDKPAGTWDEMVRMTRELTIKGDNDTFIRRGFAFMSGWDSAVVHPFLAMLHSEGGQLFSDDYTEALLDTPEALRALENQVRMFREADADIAYAGFPSGQVSMVVMAPWWKSQLAAIMGADFANVGVAPLPRGDAGLASTAYTWFWAVDSASPNQEEAWKFLQWLNGLGDPHEPSRMGTFLAQTGIIPGRPADIQANADLVLDPFMAPFVEALEYSIPEPNVYRGQDIKLILQREIEAAWTGAKPARTALIDAKRAIDQILAEYYVN